MYVITGATGYTGSRVAEKLLAQGGQVRVVGRDAMRLEPFVKKGAEAFVADITNTGALTKAFSGAKGVYAMIPPDLSTADVLGHYQRVGDALAAAIEKSGVKYAVVLSSVGADKPDKTGPVVGLYNLEKKLGAIPGLNALYLRPAAFMENLLPQVGVIKAFGTMAGPVKDDLPIPMIATRDIGDAAANALSRLDFQGKSTRELQGARDVTHTEAAKIIGAAIGKPDLTYKQMPAAQLKPGFMQMGMSSNMADLLLELADAQNSGHLKVLEPRSPRNTTLTTLETFVAEVFAPAYRGQKAARA
ncbi:MAG TPA: NmrA family NAD(P)-binding protein [Candidatus Sulfotelmatobacter sp.]|nr:NmrA family NAD(P)-binding protein [Candidatus Sulfotelmatobacter sp.]